MPIEKAHLLLLYVYVIVFLHFWSDTSEQKILKKYIFLDLPVFAGTFCGQIKEDDIMAERGKKQASVLRL